MLRTAKLKLVPIARCVAAAIALCVAAGVAHASDGRSIVSGAAASATGRLQTLGPPTIPPSMGGAAESAGGAGSGTPLEAPWSFRGEIRWLIHLICGAARRSYLRMRTRGGCCESRWWMQR